MLRKNSIQKIIQNHFCMVNSIQNLIQNFEISWIQFNKIFIQFEIVGIDHGYSQQVDLPTFCRRQKNCSISQVWMVNKRKSQEKFLQLKPEDVDLTMITITNLTLAKEKNANMVYNVQGVFLTGTPLKS